MMRGRWHVQECYEHDLFIIMAEHEKQNNKKNLNIYSLNGNGLGNFKKKKDVFDFLRKQRGIFFFFFITRNSMEDWTGKFDQITVGIWILNALLRETLLEAEGWLMFNPFTAVMSVENDQ